MAIREKIYKYLVEIITIFIGITLSFAFEEFRQSRDERNDRKEIIQSLIIDIDFKRIEIGQDKRAIQWQYATIDSCLALAKKSGHVPDEMIKDLYSVLAADFSHFEPTTPSFISLTSTGIWKQLPDSLRRRIYDSFNVDFAYLNTMYKKSAEYSSFIQEHYLVPMALMKPLEVAPDYSMINKALTVPEFRSALLIFRNQNFNTINQLDNALANLERLRASLGTCNQ